MKNNIKINQNATELLNLIPKEPNRKDCILAIVIMNEALERWYNISNSRDKAGTVLTFLEITQQIHDRFDHLMLNPKKPAQKFIDELEKFYDWTKLMCYSIFDTEEYNEQRKLAQQMTLQLIKECKTKMLYNVPI